MTVTYHVDGGPLHCRIDDEEILDAGNVEDAMSLISDAVMDDFQQKVSPGYDEDKVREAVERLFKQREEDDSE